MGIINYICNANLPYSIKYSQWITNSSSDSFFSFCSAKSTRLSSRQKIYSFQLPNTLKKDWMFLHTCLEMFYIDSYISIFYSLLFSYPTNRTYEIDWLDEWSFYLLIAYLCAIYLMNLLLFTLTSSTPTFEDEFQLFNNQMFSVEISNCLKS